MPNIYALHTTNIKIMRHTTSITQDYLIEIYTLHNENFRRPMPFFVRKPLTYATPENTRTNQNLCDIKYALHKIYSNLCTKIIF